MRCYVCIPPHQKMCAEQIVLAILQENLLVQVRFHPHNRDLLASGSLDGYVRLFSIQSGECIKSHYFGKSANSYHVVNVLVDTID